MSRDSLVKKALHSLVRVYPRPWRERYADELRALLDDAPPRWADLFDIFKEAITMRMMSGITFKVLATGLCAAGIAGFAMWLIPVTYESRAVVSTTSRDPGERNFTDEVNIFAQRALSRDNLIRLMESRNLYPGLRAAGNTDEALRTMRRGVRFSKTIPRSNLALTSISFWYPDPYLAKMATRDLVANFIDENIRQSIAELTAKGVTAEGKPLDWNLRRVTTELVVPANDAERQTGPKPVTVVSLAGAEAMQLALIVLLIRRRTVSTLPLQPTGTA